MTTNFTKWLSSFLSSIGIGLLLMFTAFFKSWTVFGAMVAFSIVFMIIDHFLSVKPEDRKMFLTKDIRFLATQVVGLVLIKYLMQYM